MADEDDFYLTTFDMILICLGNFGKKYQKSRHNIGQGFGEWLVAKLKVKSEKLKVKLGRNISLENGWKVIMPECFMNESGPFVRKLLKIVNCKLEKLDQVTLVHDDLDLPFGEFKIQFGRGAAGHHGVESVAKALGTDQFWRIRIGIGRPPQGIEPENFVLMPFKKEEEEELPKIFGAILLKLNDSEVG